MRPSINANSYWNNDHFILPVSGIYSVSYSIMANINSWINKGSNFDENSYRFSMNFNNNIYSSNYVLNTTNDDTWYFIVQSLNASIINPQTLYSSYINNSGSISIKYGGET